jgi:hypothetical protein
MMYVWYEQILYKQQTMNICISTIILRFLHPAASRKRHNHRKINAAK